MRQDRHRDRVEAVNERLRPEGDVFVCCLAGACEHDTPAYAYPDDLGTGCPQDEGWVYDGNVFFCPPCAAKRTFLAAA